MRSTITAPFFAVLFVTLLGASGCNLSGLEAKATSAGAPAPAPQTGTGTPAGPVAAIQGQVQSNSSSGSGGLSVRQFSLGRPRRFDAAPPDNACASGQYSASLVGGGGGVTSTGAFSGGEFSLSGVPVGQELIITFLCHDGSTQRCLAKAGDHGLLCDPVADAVLSAFESALGQAITAPAFRGKPLSKVATSIVEAAQSDSTAAEGFRLGIDACRAAGGAVSACDQNVINASVFLGPFQLMRSMAQGWTIDAIFNFIADVTGFGIDVDSFIYSDLATALDQSLGTDFVAQTRLFISSVVSNQLAGTDDGTVIKLECRMSYSKYHAGGSFRFAPVLATVNGIEQPSCRNDAALAVNGIDAATADALFALNAMGDYTPLQLGTVPCNTPNGWDQSGYSCVYPPNLAIVSKFSETDRNDPDGTHANDNLSSQTISMIGAFPELMGDMYALANGDYNTAHHCFTMSDHNGPTVAPSDSCQLWFASWLATERGNFAGLLGLYLYLKDGTSGTTPKLLSLDNLYRIFIKPDFLSVRFASWGPNLTQRNLSNNRWVPALLARTDAGLSVQDVFRQSFAFPADPATGDALLNTALAAATPLYNDTFQMFETVPTSDVIHDYVFGSSHHEEWNPFGSTYFYASGIGLTGKPVFCRMTNKTTGAALENELSDNTRIDCLSEAALAALGVNAAVADDGTLSLPSDFAFPYVLQERGWMGDNRGRIYALADRRTGMTVRPGGQELLLEQLHPGNPVDAAHPGGQCNAPNQAGTVVTAKLRYGYGSDTRDEAVQAYCLDMSAFTVSSQISFYWGGNLNVSQSDGAGNTWQWSVGEVGRVKTANGFNPTDIAPVCYFAPSGNFVFDAQTGFVGSGGDGVIGGAYFDAGGRLMSLGVGALAARIAPCDSTDVALRGLTKYNLIQLGSHSNGVAKADLRAFLIPSQSPAKTLQYRDWGQDLVSWDELFIYLDAQLIEDELAVNEPATDGKVAPDVAPTYAMSVKLLNQKHNAKFDPYCDDVTGPNGVPNGKCDCFTAGTTQYKDPDSCTLLDDAAEPTLSQPPFPVGQSNSADYQDLFARLGGHSGEALHYVDDAHTTPFDNAYLQAQQLWFNIDDAFQCAFKTGGETTYRKPRYIRWDGFWKNHDGCPKSDGSLAASSGNPDADGGPIRLISPKPMRNAFDVARPNTLIKLINYATKTTGQGVTLGRQTKAFSFDEALALTALRLQMPPRGLKILDGASEATGMSPMFQSVRVSDGEDNNPVTAVLRGLTRPEQLE